MRWIGILSLVVACTHEKPAPAPANAPPAPAPVVAPAPPRSPPRLFTDAEITVATTEVLARIGQNATRSCPGPKLLGATTAGASGPDIIAIVEGTGDLATCMGRLATMPKGPLDAKTPEAVALDKDCGALLESAVHRAATHEQGCSPYQVGVHVDPKSWMPPIQVAHLIGFHARNEKDPAKAAAMLLDALRFEQDVERGHTTLIAAMISVASSEILGARLDAILDTAKLSKPQLDELAGALDRLIAALPTFSEMLAGEREAQELFYGIGPLMGPDWTPPGGWGDMKPGKPDPNAKRVADPRDEAAALLAAVEVGAAERDKACPASANLHDCRAGLEKVGSGKAPDPLDVEALWKQGMTDEPGMRMKIRQQIIAILAAVAQPVFAPYVTKVMGTMKRLGELRLHVEVLRTHGCPPPFVAPAGLGEQLEIKVDKRELTVSGWTLHCR